MVELNTCVFSRTVAFKVAYEPLWEITFTWWRVLHICVMTQNKTDVFQCAEPCWWALFHDFLLENAVCDLLAYFSDLQVTATLQVETCDCGLTDRLGGDPQPFLFIREHIAFSPVLGPEHIVRAQRTSPERSECFGAEQESVLSPLGWQSGYLNNFAVGH